MLPKTGSGEQPNEWINRASVALHQAMRDGHLLVPIVATERNTNGAQVSFLTVPSPVKGEKAVAVFTSRMSMAEAGLSVLHRCACPDPSALAMVLPGETLVALDVGTTYFILTDLAGLLVLWDSTPA